MKAMKNVAVVGAGALGVLHAEKLATVADIDLAFIADGERYQRLTHQHLSVNGQPFHIEVKKPQDNGRADLVIVAVKHQHLPDSIALIAPLVGPGTTIISLLNGLDSEESLQSAYPQAVVLPCIAVGMDAVRVGSEVTYQNAGKLIFGAVAGTGSDEVEALRHLCKQSGITCDTPQQILKTVWWKFMVNVGVNQVSAVAAATYGKVRESAELSALMTDAMREVIALSQHAGIDLDEGALEQWYAVFNTLSATGKTSMLQDVEAGRQTEVDIFAGKVLKLAQHYKVDTPVNRTLYRLIKGLEPAVG